MKAVIMAGGEGSRLRPLTLDTPKPLTRLCGTAVVEYILELLKRHGLTSCVVTAGYMQEEMRRYFERRPADGMQIAVACEKFPLGTAGSVRSALQRVEDDGEEVLVISGDALCGADLSDMLAGHRARGAQATILCKRVGDPREYGLVLCGDGGRVRGFVEKPPLSQATTNLANTGVYLFNREALARIPDGGAFDFAADLFPALLQGDAPVHICETQAYWCDIGEIGAYRQCQYDLLEGTAGISVPGARAENGCFFRGSRPELLDARGPVYVGENVLLSAHVRVEGPCVLEDGVSAGAGTLLEGGVYLQGCRIGGRVVSRHAVVCAGASVKSGARLHEGCAIGPKASVGAGASVEPGVRVWQLCRIPDGTAAGSHMTAPSPRREERLDDEGYAGEVGAELTPEALARLGCALGSVFPAGGVALACDGRRSSRALVSALAAGIQSTGAQALDFGAACSPVFEFCMSYAAADLGAYVTTGPAGDAVRLAGPGALGVPRGPERKIEGFLARGEFTRAAPDRFGERLDMRGTRALYRPALLRRSPAGLWGVAARVRSADPEAQKILLEVLKGLGCDLSCGPLFSLVPQGGRLCLRIEDERAGVIRPERAACLLALAEFSSGRDIAAPASAPRALEGMARRWGRAVRRYYDCPADGADQEARALAAAHPCFRDALMMTVCILSFLKTSGKALWELVEELPPLHVCSAELHRVSAAAAVMDSLSAGRRVGAQEGLLLTHRLGLALVRPSRRGDRIRVLAECADAEAAQELCDDVLSRLMRIRKEGLDNLAKEL